MNQFHRWFCNTPLWQRHLDQTLIPWVLSELTLGDMVLELGPGPGLATNRLLERTKHLTTLEIDSRMAAALQHRMKHENVVILEGDATDMQLSDSSFSEVICFNMLHHVPSPELQDRLFAEARRVLKPEGRFIGQDHHFRHKWDPFHAFDTLISIDPETLTSRLEKAGFQSVAIQTRGAAFKFSAVGR